MQSQRKKSSDIINECPSLIWLIEEKINERRRIIRGKTESISMVQLVLLLTKTTEENITIERKAMRTSSPRANMMSISVTVMGKIVKFC